MKVGTPTDQLAVDGSGNLTFAGAAGLYIRTLYQADLPAAGPGATQVDTGEMLFWVDSDDERGYLIINYGGTVYQIELGVP